MKTVNATASIELSPLLRRADNLLERENRHLHGPLFPQHIRALVVRKTLFTPHTYNFITKTSLAQIGKSGSGKTSVVVQALLSPNGPSFERLFVFTSTKEQSKYKLLKQVSDLTPGIETSFCEDFKDLAIADRIPDYSLLVLDDFCSRIKDYAPLASIFTFGRHKNTSVIAISQSYVKLPRSLIRGNANVIILFPVDNLTLRHVFDEHISQFCTYSTFEKITRFAWSNKFDFLFIDLEACPKSVFRVNFDKIIQFQDENEAKSTTQIK
jgi:hypothetical protein